MRASGERPYRTPSLWSLVAAALLAALLLPVPEVAAAQEPEAATGASAPAAEEDGAAGPEDSADGLALVRNTGADKYALSLAMAQALVDAAGDTSEWVVLASGESWVDAVAAGPLAASLDAPVVLVPPGGLQTATARPDLVEFLRSSGVRRVAIVGSPEVLPNHEPSVLYGLGMLPRNIERIHGDDLIGNAIAVAERLGAPAVFGELGRTVIVASDQSVADAVSVGPLAAAGPFPLLPTAHDALDARIAAYLTKQDVEHVVLIGGAAAIAPAVQDALQTAGATVTRLAGRDRDDTARLTAELFEQHTADNPACTEGPTRIGLAPAQQPEQALTAGPLLSRQCAPLRYTEPDQLPLDLRNALYLARRTKEATELHLFADTASISGDLFSDTEFLKPPFRLAFGTHIQDGGEWEAVIALVDEHHEMTLLLEGERFGGTDWINWSPDGRHLAFGASQDGIWGAFLLDSATGEHRRITPASDHFYFSNWAEPEWSPSGDYLAMSTQAYSLYGSEIDGTHRGVDLFVFEMETGELSQLTQSLDQDVFRGWSPDGEWILIERSNFGAFPPGLGPYGDEYYLISPASGVATQLTLDGQGVSRWSWAPSGKLAAVEIAAPHDPSYPTPELAIAATEDLPRVELMHTGSQGHVAGWSDDGRYLAAISDYTRDRTISIVDSQFELVAELPSLAKGTSSGSTSYRGWQPGSRRVLIGQYRYSQRITQALALFDVDTSETTAIPLAEAGRYYLQFTFSPDGSQLAAVVREGSPTTRHVVVHDLKAPSAPFDLIDLSEYTPPTEEITTVHIRWLDVGIRGTIEWHYDF